MQEAHFTLKPFYWAHFTDQMLSFTQRHIGRRQFLTRSVPFVTIIADLSCLVSFGVSTFGNGAGTILRISIVLPLIFLHDRAFAIATFFC